MSLSGTPSHQSIPVGPSVAAYRARRRTSTRIAVLTALRALAWGTDACEVSIPDLAHKADVSPGTARRVVAEFVLEGVIAREIRHGRPSLFRLRGNMADALQLPEVDLDREQMPTDGDGATYLASLVRRAALEVEEARARLADAECELFDHLAHHQGDAGALVNHFQQARDRGAPGWYQRWVARGLPGSRQILAVAQ